MEGFCSLGASFKFALDKININIYTGNPKSKIDLKAGLRSYIDSRNLATRVQRFALTFFE